MVAGKAGVPPSFARHVQSKVMSARGGPQHMCVRVCIIYIYVCTHILCMHVFVRRVNMQSPSLATVPHMLRIGLQNLAYALCRTECGKISCQRAVS